MLKFHLRLLLLISTITIISFIGLGAIIHNTIYQTLTSNQIKSLDSEARNYVNLFNNNKEKELEMLGQLPVQSAAGAPGRQNTFD